MSILTGRQIREISPAILSPFVERSVHRGKSYGLSLAGYDVRTDQKHTIHVMPGQFVLLATIERFRMPLDIMGFVHDKSTWARMGLAVQNTVIEPGWEGYLTLEVTNHGLRTITLCPGDPIAQIVFHKLSEPVEHGYSGKYQNQEAGPQGPRLEE